MSRYLVTGGAGFIGSNIAEKLVESGHSVRIADNLSTGKYENIKAFIDDVDFICGDLSKYDVARRAVEGIDYILHQAAIPSVPLSVKDPLSSNDSMVTATVNLFKAAVDCKCVKRIVQASSSAVYGDLEKLPKVEEMAPTPLSPYAAAKLAQEYYGRVFYNIYGLEVISLRYFNVFGPRQDPNSLYSAVIPKFVTLMLEDKAPVIYGDGLTSRDFIYVDDVVEANILACACRWPGQTGEINIGSGQSTTLNQLVSMINDILGKDITANYEEVREGDIKVSVADISKAERILGFNSKVSLYQGLAKLTKWYMNKYRIAV